MDGPIVPTNPPEQWGVDPTVTIVVRHPDHQDVHVSHAGQVHPVQQEEDDLRHLLIRRADTADPYRSPG